MIRSRMQALGLELQQRPILQPLNNVGTAGQRDVHIGDGKVCLESCGEKVTEA